MKTGKKAALVVGILVLLVSVELIRESTASMRGHLVAHYDVWRGHYVQLVYGLPPPERPQYAQLLRERYGIQVQAVAACIVSQTLQSYANSYDEVAMAAANQKFAHDVFRESAEAASAEWESHRMAVPEFSISVKLSQAAQAKINSTNQSILVSAYFDGDPLPGKGKDNSPMRGVVLGSDVKTADANNVATFADAKFSKSDWDDLANKDYYVTVNVVSMRKSTEDNLLECNAPSDRISTFIGKPKQAVCGLIGEHDAPRN